MLSFAFLIMDARGGGMPYLVLVVVLTQLNDAWQVSALCCFVAINVHTGPWALTL